jgi:hypothetical protein
MVAHTHPLRVHVEDGMGAWRVNSRSQHLVFAKRLKTLEWQAGDYLAPSQPSVASLIQFR